MEISSNHNLKLSYLFRYYDFCKIKPLYIEKTSLNRRCLAVTLRVQYVVSSPADFRGGQKNDETRLSES